jgi:Skp family chaperone for outer membrane proteins
LPSLRSFAQLRALLPYAARLLPIVAAASSPAARADLSAIDRHFGDIQSESRGLRTRVEDQAGQLDRMQRELSHVSAAMDRLTDRFSNHLERSQQELVASFQTLAALLRGLFFAILFLLVTLTALSILMLFRISRLS